MPGSGNIKFADGFEQYGSVTDMDGTYLSITGVYGNDVILVTGRGGVGQALELRDNGGVMIGANNLASGVIEFAGLRMGAIGGNNDFFQIRDSGTIHLEFRNGDDRQLKVYRGDASSGGTLLGDSGSKRLLDNVWYHFGIVYTINDTTGSVAVYVNDDPTPWINLTNVDTRNGANAYATNYLWYQPPGFQDGFQLDDIVSSEGSTRVGDVRVSPFYPNGNGNYAQFTGSDGNSVDNYLMVDENATPPGPDDTEYVEDNTAGNRDSYAFANASPTPLSVAGICLWARAQKTDAGSRSMKLFTRVSAIDYDADEEFPSQGVWTNFYYVWHQNPNTAAAWTPSDVDAFEGGIKVQS